MPDRLSALVRGMAAAVLSMAASFPALADPCDAPGLRNTPGAYDRCIREWYGRSNAKPSEPSYLKYYRPRNEAAQPEPTPAPAPRTFVRSGEYEGEKQVRIAEQTYKEYRATALKRIADRLRGAEAAIPTDGHYPLVSATMPFAGEMMAWAAKGYRDNPVEMASLHGFMIAADPCADNPNQAGYPLSNDLDMGNTFYDHLNRHPECTYGRMYRAIPVLLEARKSAFPPHQALACAQIEAWLARHFEDDGTPVKEPIFFQGAVYHAGDHRYLTDRLAQCRAGLRHAAAFDKGLVQPAREWVRRTGNYFADVRLVRFYDRQAWAQVRNYDDPAQIRAVFDEVIKDFNTITRAHPAMFSRGIDQRGGGWHAYR